MTPRTQRERWRALRDDPGDWAGFAWMARVWIVGGLLLWPLLEWFGWLP